MKRLPVLLFILFINQLKAQTSSLIDTIALARSKAYEKNFTEADSLLTQYNLTHADINALRLHAQVLYWMKDFDRSVTLYKKTMAAFPQEPAVKLDYARMLFELNKRKQAEILLTEYLTLDNKNAEANILLAYINYWRGNIKTAKERVATLLTIYPENETALALLRELNIVSAPYIRLGGVFASDDQPLKKTGFEAEAGWYKSWWFAPTLQLNINHFTLPDSNKTYNSLWAQAGNKLSFGISGLSLLVKGGIFKHHTDDTELFVTGSATLTQKLSKVLSAEVSTERRPYQFTTTSVSIPVMQQFSMAAINLNKENKWLGRAAYQTEQFDDNNKIQTFYLWLLAPIITKKTLSLKGGYAFNHSNADINRYTPKKSMSTIIQSTAVGGLVEGYYSPYFTPNNQTIHAALASIGIHFSDKINFTSRVSVVLLATADNPDLILARSQPNNYSINKTYGKISYRPIDIYNELLMNLSDQFSLSVSYQYSHLLFYTINQGSIHLKYRFIDAKK